MSVLFLLMFTLWEEVSRQNPCARLPQWAAQSPKAALFALDCRLGDLIWIKVADRPTG